MSEEENKKDESINENIDENINTKEAKEPHHIHKKNEHLEAKEEKRHAKRIKKSDLDEGIEINIPNIFKRKKKDKKDEKNSEKEVKVEFDTKKLLAFLKKPWLLTLILLIIPLFFAIHLRIIGQDLPLTDVWAQQTVTNYYQSSIINQISSQYPNLPDANKQQLVQQQWESFYSKNKEQIDNQIKQQSEYFKSTYRYENALGEKDYYTYMPDIDPYFYLRNARNILEHGYDGDIKYANGTMWDTHMLAPKGVERRFDMHNWVLAYMYKVMHAFNKRITLMQAATYFPAIIIALSVIPAFFLAKRLAGNVAGFFSGMIVATSLSILNRTTWGHADTDAYNVLFPLLAIWVFYEMFHTRKTWKQVIFALLLSFILAIYSFFWQGWWYMFDLMIATFGVTVLYNLYLHRKDIKGLKIIKNKDFAHPIILGLIFFFGTGIITLVLGNFALFKGAFIEPFNFMTIKMASQVNLWPNVLTTVAELNPGNLSSIISHLGGKVFFIIAILGFIFISLKKDKNNHYDIKYSLLLVLWFLATIYSSFKGIRFTILIAPAFAIGFGVAVGVIYKWIVNHSEQIHIKRYITGPIVVILFLLLFISPMKSAYAIAKNDMPMINDAWYESLTAIRDNSSEDAIINSWWDFGHHFKYIADRAVTFDGASQSGPQAHWIGLALMTDNEKLAVGIIRMLDCSGNDAYDEIMKLKNYPPVSVEIIYRIVVEDKDKAKKILLDEGFTSEQSEKIISYTHCDPPENFFITSQDMIGKSGVWAHFGSWDFHKADMWVNLRKLPKDEFIKEVMKPEKEFGFTEQQAEQYYYQMQTLPDEAAANSWIAPWPGYMSNIGQCYVDPKVNETMICMNGVIINLTTYDVTIALREGKKHPRVVVFDAKDDIGVKYYNTSDVAEIGVSIFPDGNGYSSILSSPVIATSLYNKLFFFNGKGMKYFDKFIERRDITGFKIQVWKIDWDGKPEREIIKTTNPAISTVENAE